MLLNILPSPKIIKTVHPKKGLSHINIVTFGNPNNMYKNMNLVKKHLKIVITLSY